MKGFLFGMYVQLHQAERQVVVWDACSQAPLTEGLINPDLSRC